MSGLIGTLVAAAVFLLLGGFLAWKPIRLAWRKPRFDDARRSFHWHREHLEAKFIDLAQSHAKPGTPRWIDCDFDDDVAYVRNRYTGELSAFVAVTIAMQRPGGFSDRRLPDDTLDEDFLDERSPKSFDVVGNVRAATAVFRFDRDHWATDGRAIFNLSPSETIRFYQHDLEMVGQELATRR